MKNTVVCSLRDPQTAELLAVARRMLRRTLRDDQELLAALSRRRRRGRARRPGQDTGVIGEQVRGVLRPALGLLPRRADYAGLRRSGAAT